ncbi:hypothetical protein CPT_Marzo_005 [Stenotrophomonas phage Marzo]|nr:hypothetical protein CPT_Marzo_005 [Stenotrophomonas phage Marzo]
MGSGDTLYLDIGLSRDSRHDYRSHVIRSESTPVAAEQSRSYFSGWLGHLASSIGLTQKAHLTSRLRLADG